MGTHLISNGAHRKPGSTLAKVQS